MWNPCSHRLLPLALAWIALGSSCASAEVIAYRSVDRGTRVFLAPAGGAQGRYFMRVTGGGTMPDTVAAIRQVPEGSGSRYENVGGHGIYVILDRKEETLVEGTIIPYLELFYEGREPPVKLIREKSAPMDVTEAGLKQAYWAENGLGPYASETAAETEMRKVLDGANSACGGKTSFQVSWSGFKGRENPFEAASASRLFREMKDLCSDADYREAIRKISNIRLVADGGEGLRISHESSELIVRFGKGVANPGYQFHALLKDQL